MPRVPVLSPATALPTHKDFIHTTNGYFLDNAGRVLLLRGVNLSGASKAPVGRPSYIRDGFWEAAEDGGESFVGRPLNLDDGSADVHLARLKGWGFNVLRYPVTWEALEHEGPGKYDNEFIDYTVRVLRKCKEYGFRVYMDPHQDTWSRFSGGSGAPYWTLPACGINPNHISATQAAILHCEYPSSSSPAPATLPAMLWSTNYGRFLSQTIFTLFFAGHAYAPRCRIDGQNIQDFLQSHFLRACGALARAIATCPDNLLDECVIGWDSLNEPCEGLVGWPDLNSNPEKQGTTLKKGTHPTPAQGLRLAMGCAQVVDNYAFGAFGPVRAGRVEVDPQGKRLWATAAELGEDTAGHSPRWGWTRDRHTWELGTCVWAQHGVWDVETGFMLRPDYFAVHPQTGDPVEFVTDFWAAHWVAFAREIRTWHPEAIVCVQTPVFVPPPSPAVLEGEMKGRCVYTPHYYDGLTLVTRHWNWFNADALGLLRGRYGNVMGAVKIGEGAIRKSLQEQLGYLKGDSEILRAGEGVLYPVVIGEIGIPFDMDAKRAYYGEGGTVGDDDNDHKGKKRRKGKGDYSKHERALDASLNAADGENVLGYTVWTYCTDGTHEWGDGWNMEDLSLWCADDLRRDQERQQEGCMLEARGREGGWPGTAGESQAALVQQYDDKKYHNQVSHMVVPVSTSQSALSLSVSLATHAGETVMEVGETPPDDGAHAAGWDTHPYQFLTHGARAVRAFCRPRPLKVVGRPAEVHFDVGKAWFRMVVRVDGADGEACLREVGPEGEKPIARVATEVYVPLVHYAHARLVRGVRGVSCAEELHVGAKVGELRVGRFGDNNVEMGAMGSSADSDRRARSRSASTSTMDLPGMRTPGSASLSTSSTMTAPPSPVPLHALPGTIGAGAAAPLTIAGRELVDVEVNVSEGMWAVEGQVLQWWYDAPAIGQGEKTVWIEVRRKGGVIKVVSEDEECVSGREGGYASICERMCPEEGCCVM